MPHFRYSVRVPLNRERAFALYTNAERLTDWFPGAKAVENLTEPIDRPGARYTIRFHARPDAHEEVLEVVPDALHRRRFVQVSGGVGGWGDARIHLRTVNGETEIEENVEYGFQPAWLAGLLSVFYDAWTRKALQGELDGFKRLAEWEASGVAGDIGARRAPMS